MSSIKTKWMDVVLGSLLYFLLGYILCLLSLPSDQKRHKISVPMYSEAPHSPPPSHHPNLKVFFSCLFSMNSSRNKLLWLSCLPKISASLRAETPCLSQSIAALRVKFRSRQGWVKTCHVYVCTHGCGWTWVVFALPRLSAQVNTNWWGHRHH